LLACTGTVKQQWFVAVSQGCWSSGDDDLCILTLNSEDAVVGRLVGGTVPRGGDRHNSRSSTAW